MNEKAVKLVITILLLIGLSFSVSAIEPADTALCLNPDHDTCTVVEAQQCCTLGSQDYEECLAAYFRPNKQVSDYSSCDFGTCLLDCGDKFRLQCNDPSEFVQDGVPDARIGLCEAGCCIVTTTQGGNQCEPTNNEVQCNAFLQESGAVTSVAYSVDVTSDSCTALCAGELPKGTLIGIVKDADGKFNLQGVKVEAGDRSTTTGQDGSFILTAVTATKQFVKFSIAGYNSVTKTETVTADQTENIGTTELSVMQTATVRGYVKDATGAALGGAVISYLGFEVITNQQGLFELTGLPTKQLGELRAIRPNYLPKILEIQIPTPTIVVLDDIILSQTATCKVNTRLSSNLPQDSCKCGDTTFETSNTGYCCEGDSGPEYNAGACEGNVKAIGFVSQTNGDPVFDARVELKAASGKVFFDDTSVLGNYEINLPEGDYDVKVQDSRFKTYESTLTVAGDTTLNIVLEPSVATCDSDDPPVPDVQPLNIRGSKNVNITWKDQCPALQYIISVNGTVKANRPATATYAIVNDLDWGKSYEITFKAVYNNNRVFSKTFVISPGNALCEGKTLGNSKFCLDTAEGTTGIPVLQVFCNENNQIATGPDFNCPEFRPGSLCAGPDSNGETQCVVLTSCSQGSITNPFGLFTDKDTCEFYDKSQNLKNYCYSISYDYQKSVCIPSHI